MSGSLLCHFPVFHRACFRREAYADAVEFAGIIEIGAGITFLFNLAESFPGGAVQFKFKDINVMVCFDDAIHAAFALLLFGIDGVNADEAHEQVERVVEVTFFFALVFLTAHGIRDIAEERGEQAAEFIGVAFL